MTERRIQITNGHPVSGMALAMQYGNNYRQIYGCESCRHSSHNGGDTLACKTAFIDMQRNRCVKHEISPNVSKFKDPVNPLATQVGGNHYAKLKIQPAEYAHANGLGGLQMNAIKYVTRFKDKGGAQDLDKAIHSIQLLKELEYPKCESKTS